MRKIFITIALFAVLGTLAVSCQKENIIDDTCVVAENGTVFTVSYSVDGATHHITLIGEDAWHDFLNRMFALAEEGHVVSFRNEEASSRVVPSKDVVIFSTKDHDKAYAWADAMSEEGYTVTISYDRETGIYTCEAVK